MPGLRTEASRHDPDEGKARLASMIGNTLEWYDFAIYGYFAATIGATFRSARLR